MATKKGSKSSKTAHVLNVLSGTKQENALEEGRLPGEEAQVSEQTEAPPRPPVRAPILEMARANDEVLSDQIQQLLEEDWEEEEAVQETDRKHEQEEIVLRSEQAEAEDALPVEETEPAWEAAAPLAHSELDPMEETEPVEIPQVVIEEEPVEIPQAVFEEEPEEAPQVAVEEEPVEAVQAEPLEASSPTAGEPGSKPSAQEDQEDFCPVNVMQVLVEEKCMRYIKMFGMCDCSRCVADVKALALSNLIPKYLVMRRSEVVPMLTVYEGRFNATLTAQLIQACKVVMDHPRHG